MTDSEDKQPEPGEVQSPSQGDPEGVDKADKLGSLLREHFRKLRDEPLPDELTALVERLANSGKN